MVRNVLICTLGTSLFYPNLESISEKAAKYHGMFRAYRMKDWEKLAESLYELDPQDRICGAEINGVYDFCKKGFSSDHGSIHFCHSATEAGRDIAQVLDNYFTFKRLASNLMGNRGSTR